MTQMKNDLEFSVAATQYANSTNQFSFDAELHESGRNKANLLHFHDFYEVTIYLGKESAQYRLNGQKYDISFGDVVRCDLMDEHMWLLDDNEHYTRFTVGMSPSFVMSSSTKEDNLLRIFSRGGNSYPVLQLGSMEIHKYVDLINAYQNCALEYGKLVFQQGVLHQMLAYLQDDFMHHNIGTAALTRQDSLVCELINYINLHIGEDLSLETLGRVTNYNPTYLSRTFKNATHNTLKSYIDEKRVQTATLLIGKGMTLSEIAAEVGFQNYCTFYNTFRRIIGDSPENYSKCREGREHGNGKLIQWNDSRMHDSGNA